MTGVPALEVIGHIRSPYAEKFGTPRQSGLVEEVEAKVEIQPPFDDPLAFKGLSEASHVWLLWHFHANPEKGQAWRRQVRPPRLGGNQKIGVFASRSGFRPNPLGMSVVRLLDIDCTNGLSLRIAGADLIDRTPVFDIKPYVPYVDAVPDATLTWADQTPQTLRVVWEPTAVTEAEGLGITADRRQAISAVLAQDPRPAYHDDDREYGVSLFNHNIGFTVQGDRLVVKSLSN